MHLVPVWELLPNGDRELFANFDELRAYIDKCEAAQKEFHATVEWRESRKS
jgi:hypothetical protein